eukprot:scaffold281237_cov17-Tisochrysis_lutea.AAC.1
MAPLTLQVYLSQCKGEQSKNNDAESRLYYSTFKYRSPCGRPRTAVALARKGMCKGEQSCISLRARLRSRLSQGVQARFLLGLFHYGGAWEHQ